MQALPELLVVGELESIVRSVRGRLAMSVAVYGIARKARGVLSLGVVVVVVL